MEKNKQDNLGLIFKNVVDRIYTFTKLDTIPLVSVFNASSVKLIASFLVILTIAFILYVVGNIILLLVYLSLAQYLTLISIITIITFIVLMVKEEGLQNQKAEIPTSGIKTDDAKKKELK